MKVRAATLEDAENLASLVRSLAHFYIDQDTDNLPLWLAETLTTSAFERRLTDDNYVNLVCVIDNKIVGYIALKEKSHLYHLFVDKNFHGRGIARMLWTSLSPFLSKSTPTTVRSSVYAVPVYQKLGFIICGEKATKNGVSFQPMEIKTSP
ncbi:GNAT family N-acetyltransferase [Glaciecola sp. 1036]|uniref:GNAT family N-acetyltransferase n=1 Tax=Alteromonadaceae TaxID=72275 RepID=UPI003D030ABF